MFKSITLKNLNVLLKELHQLLGIPVKLIYSDTIRNGLKDGKLKHPAKLFPKLFSEDEPQVAVTYQWSLGLDRENGLLKLAEGRNQNLRIWLDVLFIDQLSTNIPMNLAKAQEVYGLSDQHWVFGTEKLLSRGWCLFEICLRASQNRQSLILGDLGS